MRAVIQSVKKCSISVNKKQIAHIDEGILIYLGVTHSDTNYDAEYLANKILNIRIFADEQGKMNISALSKGLDLCVVSQFTLYADVRKGRRPSFNNAAEPGFAEKLYQKFIKMLESQKINVQHGQFGAMMEVGYINNGPLTFLLDSQKQF